MQPGNPEANGQDRRQAIASNQQMNAEELEIGVTGAGGDNAGAPPAATGASGQKAGGASGLQKKGASGAFFGLQGFP